MGIMRRLLLVVVVGLCGCESHLEAKVGGAVLPQASGVVPASAGPTLVIKPGQPAPALGPGPVRLAIDIAVPWRELTPLFAAADTAGAQPSLLVGQRHRIHGFVLSDAPTDEPSLRLRATATGKFCLSPPGTREAYCVESGDRRHISAAYVREAVQKAVAAYGITAARVFPDDDARWADIVRTIDGARTCCGKRPFRVTVIR